MNKCLTGQSHPAKLTIQKVRLGLTWRSHAKMAKTLDIETSLSEREARLIEVLGDQTTQRTLARDTGFSLGMTNLLIKRLVKKGIIKVVSMNGRTLSYILTPKGFAEKVRRSYDYLASSIRHIARVRSAIRQIISETDIDERIYLLGGGELGLLTEETLRDMGRKWTTIARIEELDGAQGALCLVCGPEMPEIAPPGVEVRMVLQ